MNDAPLRRFASAVRTSTSRSGLVRGLLAESTSALVADSSATVASSRSSSFCTTTSCGSSARTASASCVGQRLHVGRAFRSPAAASMLTTHAWSGSPSVELRRGRRRCRRRARVTRPRSSHSKRPPFGGRAPDEVRVVKVDPGELRVLRLEAHREAEVRAVPVAVLERRAGVGGDRLRVLPGLVLRVRRRPAGGPSPPGSASASPAAREAAPTRWPPGPSTRRGSARRTGCIRCPRTRACPPRSMRGSSPGAA